MRKSSATGKQDRVGAVLTRDQVLAEELQELGPEIAGGRSALCLSGGGIRSATFCLGVLQALGELKLLSKFDYLSTVSGGGYIGGWLTAWMDRHPKGPAGVEDEIAGRGPEEPKAVLNLRRYANYLSPRLGLLSTDTWALAATIGRNLFLNWLVLIPFLAALAMAPALCAAFVALSDVTFLEIKAWLALGSVAAAFSMAMLARELPRFGDRNYEQGIVGLTIGWLLFLAVVFWTAAWAWISLGPGDARMDSTWWDAISVYFLLPPALAYGTGWAIGILSLKRLEPWFTLRAVLGGLGAMFAGGVQGAMMLAWYTWIAGAVPAAWLPKFYVALAMPVCVLIMVLLAAVLSVFTTGSDDLSREWWARFGGWLLIPATSWCVFSAVAIAGPMALRNPEWLKGVFASGATAGGLTAWLGHSAMTYAKDLAGKAARRMSVQQLLTGLVAPAFLILLLILLSAGGEWLVQALGGASPFQFAQRAAVMLGLVAFCLTASFLVPVNKFSLHSMYRNRLLRAYLGASREKRQPNRFTGFDENDNLFLKDLKGRGRPLHIVNVTLNDVAGKELAWQQRKARSFTFSRLHAGFEDSYRRIRGGRGFYGGKSGISLGTAMAISGAAVSPNMGYNSSPLVTFLLTLLNARLGWWLGNPGTAGTGTWRLSSPRFSLRAMLTEAFGRTAADRAYVYLSDGGHFENLALFEMIRRRCRYVVVVDSSADPDLGFAELGNALRRIRVDFGLEIVFETPLIRVEDPDKQMARTVAHCALARIGYNERDQGMEDGELLYIKPALTGDEPVDVRQYQKAAPTFPNQTTADQFFDEPQFESYRKLGYHSLMQPAKGKQLKAGAAGLPAFFAGMRALLS